ncbi:MAG: S9 family peptidase [Candidatus Methanoperedens sp.]|nr:S9 family peptidase [Candidatus Methanoperedens sp.]
MTKPLIAPYGSWKSPITSDMIASGTIRLEQVVLDGDRHHERLICVCEDHTDTKREPVNTLFSIWDGTKLCIGELNAKGALSRIKRVAGGIDESIFQPEWSPDGILHFISDKTDWWNLYCWGKGQIEPITEMEVEFGTDMVINAGYISIPRAIDFPTERGLKAHAFFYPQQNHDYIAPPGEKPLLLVISHGGPTSTVTSKLDLMIQYWTSRGFAILNVNYGGSTGFGRSYRQCLNGQWGAVDVDDCVNGARHLVDSCEMDIDRLIIRGASAGGYTTLCALTFRNTFKAGADYYGVSDLETMRKESHKFESRYLDRLIGPYPWCRDLYQKRSPINFVDNISSPVIFFQGLEDKIVPPDQTEKLFNALINYE